MKFEFGRMPVNDNHLHLKYIFASLYIPAVVASFEQNPDTWRRDAFVLSIPEV